MSATTAAEIEIVIANEAGIERGSESETVAGIGIGIGSETAAGTETEAEAEVETAIMEGETELRAVLCTKPGMIAMERAKTNGLMRRAGRGLCMRTGM
mmetsp:Transcript_21289/g.52089  ORF Transcript_21289/g.52089 Transcript_21289/m.52089 type:complete len:98 (+) Transcript_21289:557-850(+)